MKTSINHNPIGVGNPYLSGPEERIPRSPSVRDNVIIGVVTEPADKNINLTASISSSRGFMENLEAQWVKDTDSSSEWKIQIPQGSAHETFKYSFLLDNEKVSEDFSYTIDGFSTVSEVKSIKRSDCAFFLELVIGDFTFLRSFDFSVKNRIRLSQGSLINEQEFEEIVSIDSDNVVVEILDFRISIEIITGKIAILKNDMVLYSETEALEIRFNSEGKPLSQKTTLNADSTEKFFGFGERFNGFNQRGKNLDVRVYEEYKSQGEGSRTYLPIPFFLSSGNWGHCVNSSRKVAYDLTGNNSWNFEVELECMDLECYYYIGKPAEILKYQAEITGFPVLPPEWAFGPWMSSNEWNSQKRVLNELNTSRELDIPATVLVIEAWSDEKNFYIWNDAKHEIKDPSKSFKYDDFTFPEEGLWPNPKAMIDDIHSDETKIILWQIPVSKKLEPGVTCEQNAQDKQYMIDKGYCVKNEDGSPYLVKPWWFTDSLVVDFTSKEATDWWMKKREYLIDDLGIDGFKTDGGEHLWGRELQFADGRTGSELWNAYPNHYINSYYKFINEKNGGITFSRSGFMGVQNSPVHWAGDQDSTWDAHRSVLNAVLNTGISGVPFMGWDIGGFSGEIPTAELYLRSTSFACFGSIMQYHSEFFNHLEDHVDRTPWNIAKRTNSPEVIDIYRYYAKLRMELIPYILEEAEYCRQTASPLMKFLFIDYPGDQRCWDLEDQYMFGRDLIVCPILYEGQLEREVYIPEGEWVDFFTGESIESKRTHMVKTPLNKIPVFKKKNLLLDKINFPKEAK